MTSWSGLVTTAISKNKHLINVKYYGNTICVLFRLVSTDPFKVDFNY